MRIFTADAALIEAGAKYLRAVGAAYLFNGFCTIYLCSMRSVERVVMSAAVHGAAVALNVILNAFSGAGHCGRGAGHLHHPRG